jgi:hypothetical protein
MASNRRTKHLRKIKETNQPQNAHPKKHQKIEDKASSASPFKKGSFRLHRALNRSECLNNFFIVLD